MCTFHSLPDDVIISILLIGSVEGDREVTIFNHDSTLSVLRLVNETVSNALEKHKDYPLRDPFLYTVIDGLIPER